MLALDSQESFRTEYPVQQYSRSQKVGLERGDFSSLFEKQASILSQSFNYLGEISFEGKLLLVECLHPYVWDFHLCFYSVKAIFSLADGTRRYVKLWTWISTFMDQNLWRPSLHVFETALSA